MKIDRLQAVESAIRHAQARIQQEQDAAWKARSLMIEIAYDVVQGDRSREEALPDWSAKADEMQQAQAALSMARKDLESAMSRLYSFV